MRTRTVARRSTGGPPPRKHMPLPPELEQDVDKFHREREKLSLNPEEDAGASEDSLDEEEVLGLAEAPSDEEESEELDTDEEMEQETRYGQLAKQAKKLGARLRIQQGEEEEGEGAEEESGASGKAAGAWGRGKRDYYGADLNDLEGSEDEEEARDEEEEAKRLQREAAAGLRPEDFGQSESDEEESGGSSSEEESDGEQELGAAADAAMAAAAAGAAGGARHRGRQAGGLLGASVVESVPKDLGALSSQQRMEAVQQDAPELLALIEELRSSLAEVRGRVGPLLQEVKEGELATAEGVSYLEAKHLLLLNYCTCVVFYLLMKAEGRPVQNHPVIGRLVEIRAYLEKVRPIDRKLQYQIDKLLQAAQAARAQQAAGGGGAAAERGGGADDPLHYGPRPDALVPRLAQQQQQQPGGGAGGDDGGGGGDGLYRPPRLNPVSMEMEGGDDDRLGKDGRNAQRNLLRASHRASKSPYMQELAAELSGAPEEQRATMAGMDTKGALRERQRLAAREHVEEELFVRVPLSREERNRLKAQQRSGLSGQALLDDFADDVADIAGAGNDDTGIDAMFRSQRASQRFGADLQAQAMAGAKKAVRSGDADLPAREPLYERRAKMDAARAKQALRAGGSRGGSDDDAPEQLGGKRVREREEDEVYTAAKTAAAGKKKQRKESYAFPETLPPAADPTTSSARGITRDIEKNRGLTPHRRKDIKNPRKKHRLAFAKATKARKGQVQEVRSGGGSYGGEQTGIKSRLSKSTRF